MSDSNALKCHCEDIIVSSMQNGNSLKGASTFNYVMKPSAQGSLIMTATTEELIQFSPFNILKGAAQMESRYGCSKSVSGVFFSAQSLMKQTEVMR